MDENLEIETKPLEKSPENPLETDEPDIKPTETNKSTETSTVTAESAATEKDRTEILSRRRLKKLSKMARWDENKKVKRQKEREKRKERRAQEVLLGLPGACSKRKKLKQNKIDNSPNLVSVAIDFDFDELMEDHDIAKCAKQMLRVYTENRKSAMPIKLHFTSIKEDGRIEKSLSRNDGYKNWDVKIHPNSYLELFDHKSIVYLTSDSDNVLNELEPNTVYIIGGLVDHNHQKGLTLKRAEERGLRTARLPLSEHIEMKTRSVLTIVHVFEILLKVSEGKPWKETLLEVLPQRKFRTGGRQRKRKAEDSISQADKEDENLSGNESNHVENSPNTNSTS